MQFSEWMKEYKKNKLGSQRKTSQNFFVSIAPLTGNQTLFDLDIKHNSDICAGWSVRIGRKGGNAREAKTDGEQGEDEEEGGELGGRHHYKHHHKHQRHHHKH